MLGPLTLTKSQWEGNHWPSVEFANYGSGDVLPVLTTIAVGLAVPIPALVDVLDGYAADFRVAGVAAKLLYDTWTFSVAAETHELRDRIYAILSTHLPDPRVAELAALRRELERWDNHQLLAMLGALFGVVLVCLVPSPLHAWIEELWWSRFGVIDERQILVCLLLFGVPLTLATVTLAFSHLQSRLKVGAKRERLQDLRRALTAVGRIPEWVEEAASPTWGRGRRYLAGLIAGTAVVAFGFLSLLPGGEPVEDPPLFAADSSLPRAAPRARVRAYAREELRSAMLTRSTGAAWLLRERTVFSAPGEPPGQQALAALEGEPTSIVRITPLARDPGRGATPISLFLRCSACPPRTHELSAAPEVFEGRIQSGGLPGFVIRAYARAGVSVDPEYRIVDPQVSREEPRSLRWIVLAAGLLMAGLMFAWSRQAPPLPSRVRNPDYRP